MKLYSWNVNGIRAVLKKGALQAFLDEYKPDVLCLQEIKAKPEQVDFDFKGYKVFWNPAVKAGYSGTAILVSSPAVKKEIDVEMAIASTEGRVLALDLGDFYLVNVYTPNSKPDLSRLKLRENEWDPNFLKLLKELEKEKPVVTCGDFNAAHEEIDIARPKTNHHSAGFTDEERKGITNLINAGLIDTFRFLHPNEVRYTWWSHWGHARENNVGWRIDYFFVSKALKKNLKSAEIYESVTGSDHCPISIELEF
jgi:exodeoxyribonuclease-3